MYKSVVLPLNERNNDNFAEHAPLYAQENREGYAFTMNELYPIGPAQRQVIPHGTPACGAKGNKLTLPCAWAIVDEQNQIVAVAFSSDTLHAKPSIYMTDPNNPQSVPEILQTRIGELQHLHEALVHTPQEDLSKIELGAERTRASFQQAFCNKDDHHELAYEWSKPSITMQDTMGTRVMNQLIDIIAQKAQSAQTIANLDVLRENFAKSFQYVPGNDFVEAATKASLISVLALNAVASDHDSALMSQLCQDARQIAEMTQQQVQSKQMETLHATGIAIPEKFQAVFKQAFLSELEMATNGGIRCSRADFYDAAIWGATRAGYVALEQGYQDIAAQWAQYGANCAEKKAEVLGTNITDAQTRNIALHKDREDYGDPEHNGHDGQEDPGLEDPDGLDEPGGR